MTRHVISILLILTFSCRTITSEWQTLDFKIFKLKTPQGWTIVKQQGIDSYVGALTNGNDTLWFDYGWYGVNFEWEGSIKHRYAKDTVNGLSAMIIKPDTTGNGNISMYIKIDEENQFTIWGSNTKTPETVLKIYKSIVFKHSDTLNNPPLTDSKFSYYFHGSGKTLFMQNCASCHALIRPLVGPRLADLPDRRSNDWVYNFLTNRKSVSMDSAYRELFKTHSTHCKEFTDLTKDDIDFIMDYIKSR